LIEINPEAIARGDSGRVNTGRNMAKITYIQHDGVQRTVEVSDGLSVMEGAVKFHIPEIDGDCGGACACATCHVYVAPEWLARLPPMKDLERNMLQFANAPNPSSRLSCQIKVTPELDGLTVTTPVSQY
jgi:2Fe-2S ferredoxin